MRNSRFLTFLMFMALSCTNPFGNKKGTDIVGKELKPEDAVKLERMHHAVASFNQYADSLKKRFIDFCGSNAEGGLVNDESGDVSRAYLFFVTEKNGDSLQQRLFWVKEKLKETPLTDSSKVLLTSLGMLPPSLEHHPDIHDFATAYFGQVPPVAALTIVAKFRNDVNNLHSIILKEYSNLVSSHP